MVQAPPSAQRLVLMGWVKWTVTHGPPAVARANTAGRGGTGEPLTRMRKGFGPICPFLFVSCVAVDSWR